MATKATRKNLSSLVECKDFMDFATDLGFLYIENGQLVQNYSCAFEPEQVKQKYADYLNESVDLSPGRVQIADDLYLISGNTAKYITAFRKSNRTMIDLNVRFVKKYGMYCFRIANEWQALKTHNS